MRTTGGWTLLISNSLLCVWVPCLWQSGEALDSGDKTEWRILSRFESSWMTRIKDKCAGFDGSFIPVFSCS